MTSQTDGPTLEDRLAALAAFLTIFESPTFTYGGWDISDGHLPYFFPSDDAFRFEQMAYTYGWCNANINWVEWTATDDAAQFKTGPGPIGEATVSDLEHLLTTFIRQDRFVEGNLDSLFNSGHLTAVVRRADALLREMNEQQGGR